MKLWQKDKTTAFEAAARIEKFTVGNDRIFDILLAEHDVIGSIAHAKMLEKIGLLTADEQLKINTELHAILETIHAKTFVFEDGIEDIHSQIEVLLTRKLGEIGKKIHSGRSRNDQVLLDIKLYLRSELIEISERATELCLQLLDLAETHKTKLLPGYTHMQLAMPSSFGLWFGAYAESLTDDLQLLKATHSIINKNPLGSGAGFGSSFPLDRDLTTELLGFNGMNYNVVYAQMTRGKTERLVAQAITMPAATLAKFSADCCLYMNQQFGFISFPDDLTTGSSIMPHKKNPDVFELIRAKCNRIQAVSNELALLTANLSSGYHRDLQLTKEILFPAISDLKECLEICIFMLKHIRVKEAIMDDPQFLYAFSVERVNELVLQGKPFRDAYVQVGNEIQDGVFTAPPTLNHSHKGSIGNLSLDEIRMRAVTAKI
jgi:argininosuccinate lyase